MVSQPCTLISRSIVVRHCDTVTGIARPRRAVKPQRRVRGAPRGAGLDGERADRAIIMPPRCASSSDIVREIKYRILHFTSLDFALDRLLSSPSARTAAIRSSV